MMQGTLSPKSNKANWPETIELWDEDTGAAMDLSTAEDIIVTVADGTRAILTAKHSDGTITLADDGRSATFNFARSQMQQLCAKTYRIGIRVVFTEDTNELQLLLGDLPVVEGL